MPDPGTFLCGEPQKLLPDPGSPTHQRFVLAETATHPWDSAERLQQYLSPRWCHPPINSRRPSNPSHDESVA